MQAIYYCGTKRYCTKKLDTFCSVPVPCVMVLVGVLSLFHVNVKQWTFSALGVPFKADKCYPFPKFYTSPM